MTEAPFQRAGDGAPHGVYCPPVASAISAMVAPSAVCSMAIGCACLVPSRQFHSRGGG